MFAPTCNVAKVVEEVGLTESHAWSADTVNGSALTGESLILKF